MRTIRAVVVGFGACFWLFAAGAHAHDDGQEIAAAKRALGNQLKDSESARYEDVVAVSTKDDGRVVCGWVNAKNSYGGYVGFLPFYVAGEKVSIRDHMPKDALDGDGLFVTRWHECFAPRSESFGEVVVNTPAFNIEKECAIHDSEYITQCIQIEKGAQAWLQAHPTSAFIARQCAEYADPLKSYSNAERCVQEQEADIVFQRGPPTPSAAR
jgi:hypothetical protein